jgi:hypothetical protein
VGSKLWELDSKPWNWTVNSGRGQQTVGVDRKQWDGQ